jgi:hypothetical protein
LKRSERGRKRNKGSLKRIKEKKIMKQKLKRSLIK